MAQLQEFVSNHAPTFLEYMKALRMSSNNGLDIAANTAPMADDLERVRQELASTKRKLHAKEESLAGSRAQVETLRQQAQDLEASLVTAQQDLRDHREGTPVTVGTGNHHRRWRDAPTLTDGQDPSFDAWAQAVKIKYMKDYPNDLDQVYYAN